MRARLAVPLVIFLLIGQIGVVSDIANGGLEINSNSIPSSISIEDFIEDPFFGAEPDTITEGTSGEFSSSHHQAVDEEDFNYMELTWDHVANTSLDFRVGEDENLPDCLEFIYFYQDFDWPFNEMPLDAELHINMSATLSGSFATEQYGNLMFRVYVWMIDSSGNWRQVYESRDAVYSEIYQERRINLSYFDMLDAWGGMIENSTGLQEDPEDIVQVAIGLAPRFEFESFMGDNPWEFYDGSVSARIKSMELWVYMEEDPDPSQVLLPLFNNTWEYSVRDVFPDVPDEFENSTERFRDIETDADGSVYVLCESYSSYEYYIEEGNRFAYQFLLKYNMNLELIWARHLENQTRGYALAIRDGYIYTTGYIRTSDETESKNLIVTKWSPNGDVLWHTEWGGIYDEEGSAIAVNSDGSVYVWATHWNIRFDPGFWKSEFLKFDSSGILLWNKTNEVPLFPGVADLEIQPDGVYSWDSENVEKRDSACDPVWNIDLHALAVSFDDRGDIYIATTGYSSGEPGAVWQVMISKWSSTGAQLWHTNYSIPLPDGSSLYFQCRSIDIAPDGSVLAILYEIELSLDFHMLKLDSSGSLLWDKIIGDERWLSGGFEPKLDIGDNGLAYVGFDRFGDFGNTVAVSVFVVGPNTQGLDLATIMMIVGISGVGLVAVIIYIRKYR